MGGGSGLLVGGAEVSTGGGGVGRDVVVGLGAGGGVYVDVGFGLGTAGGLAVVSGSPGPGP